MDVEQQLAEVARILNKLCLVPALPKGAVDVKTSVVFPCDFGLDARLAWQPRSSMEVSVAGKNLLGARLEFLGESLTPPSAADRMVYAQLRWRWP